MGDFEAFIGAIIGSILYYFRWTPRLVPSERRLAYAGVLLALLLGGLLCLMMLGPFL